MSHTDVGRVTIDALPNEVFAALIDAEARTVWLPPAGMSGRFDWFDARPGGGNTLTLTCDDQATAVSPSRTPAWSRCGSRR